MNKVINSAIEGGLKGYYEGRVLRLERNYDPNRMGYDLVLAIYVPDDGTWSVDELEIYKRVMQIVNVISPTTKVQGD